MAWNERSTIRLDILIHFQDRTRIKTNWTLENVPERRDNENTNDSQQFPNAVYVRKQRPKKNEDMHHGRQNTKRNLSFVAIYSGIGIP